MNCPDELKIEMLLNGAIPAHEAEALERHIRECGKCGAVYREFKSLDKMLAAAAPDLPDGGYLMSLSKRHAETGGGHSGNPVSAPLSASRIFWGLIHAAAVIIIFISIWGFILPGRPGDFKIEKQETLGISRITLAPAQKEGGAGNILLGSRASLTARL